MRLAESPTMVGVPRLKIEVASRGEHWGGAAESHLICAAQSETEDCESSERICTCRADRLITKAPVLSRTRGSKSTRPARFA